MKTLNELIFAVVLMPSLILAQETRANFRKNFNESDFIFDLQNKNSDSVGKGGKIRQVLGTHLPALVGEGISMILLEIDPCAVNLPHIHPRATEIVYVISGEYVEFGFVEENGGRSLIKRVQAGQSTFIPKGLIHYVQNLGCEKTKLIGAFNSEDPGILTITTQTFMFPSQSLSATFNIDEDQVNSLKEGFLPTPVKSYMNSECLKRCGIES